MNVIPQSIPFFTEFSAFCLFVCLFFPGILVAVLSFVFQSYHFEKFVKEGHARVVLNSTIFFAAVLSCVCVSLHLLFPFFLSLCVCVINPKFLKEVLIVMKMGFPC